MLRAEGRASGPWELLAAADRCQQRPGRLPQATIRLEPSRRPHGRAQRRAATGRWMRPSRRWGGNRHVRHVAKIRSACRHRGRGCAGRGGGLRGIQNRSYRGASVSTDIVEAEHARLSRGHQPHRAGAGAPNSCDQHRDDNMPKTMFEKVWEQHEVLAETADTPAVLYIDLHLIHEVTSPQAFSVLRSGACPCAAWISPWRPWTTRPRRAPSRSSAARRSRSTPPPSRCASWRATAREFGVELLGMRQRAARHRAHHRSGAGNHPAG